MPSKDSRKRYSYKVLINTENTPSSLDKSIGKSFHYDFKSTKNIELKIFKESYAIINVDMTVVKSAKNLLIDSNLFKDAMKKILLVYLLICGEGLDVNTITVEIYDNKIKRKSDKKINPIDTYKYDNKITPIISSMIQGSLKHEIREEWTKEEIENLISLKKSNKDSREASLISFLNSKNKTFESERFLSLWMAFNGMYGYLGRFVSKKYELKEITTMNRFKNNDSEQIQLIQEFIGYPLGKVVRTKAEKLAQKIKPIIVNSYNGELTEESLKYGSYKVLSGEIEEKIRIFYDNFTDKEKEDSIYKLILNFTGYTYLLTHFSYYYRCNYFHAAKPLPLFILISDGELICFKAINDLLDEFMEKNLHKWFSNSGAKDFEDFAQKKINSYLSNHPN